MKFTTKPTRTLFVSLFATATLSGAAHGAVTAIAFDLGPDNVFTTGDGYSSAQGMPVTPSTYGTLGRFDLNSLLCFGPFDTVTGSAASSGLFNINADGSYSTAETFAPGAFLDVNSGPTGWGVITSNFAGQGLAGGTYNVGFRTSTGNYGWMNLTLNDGGTAGNSVDDVISINAAFVESSVGEGITVGNVPEPGTVLLFGLGSLLTFRRRR